MSDPIGTLRWYLPKTGWLLRVTQWHQGWQVGAVNPKDPRQNLFSEWLESEEAASEWLLRAMYERFPLVATKVTP